MLSRHSHPFFSAFITVLTLAGSVSLSACGDGPTEAAYLARAGDYLRTGNRSAAVIELSNLVREYPASAQGRWLLGRTHLESQNVMAADRELRQALKLGWPAAEVAVPLARAILLSNPQTVVDQLKLVGDEAQFPDAVRAELHLIRGRALLLSAQPAAAVTEFEAAQALAAETPAAWLAQAYVAFNRGDREEAQQWIEKVLPTQPERAEAFNLQGDLARDRDEFAAALAAHRQAVELEPANLLFRTALARAQLVSGLMEDGINNLKVVLKADSQYPEANYLRALAASNQGDHGEALVFADAVLKVLPTHAESRHVAGSSAYQLGEYERAYEYLKSIDPQSTSTSSRALRKLLTDTRMQLGLVDEVVSGIAAIEKDTDAQFLGNLGARVNAAGYSAAGKRLLTRAAVLQPDNAETQVSLAIAEMRVGDAAGSTESIERALALNPDLAVAEIMAVIGHLRNKNVEAALSGAQALVEKYPDRAISHTLLGNVHIAYNQREKAKQAFQRALAISPDDADAANNLGQILYQEKQWEAARTALQVAVAKRPADLKLLFNLAIIESELGRDAEGLAWLEKAVATNPDSAAARTTLANAYLGFGRAQQALDISSDFSLTHDLSPALRDVLGRAQLELKQHAAAAGTLAPLVELRPTDLRLQRNLARAYEGAGQFESALAALERALELDPSHKPSQFSRARILTAVGRTDEAQRIVDELKVEHPNSFELSNLEGAIAMRARRFDAAVTAYERAFEVRETNFQVLQLVSALVNAGRAEEGESLLREWLAKYPDDTLTLTVLANFYLQQGRLAEAEPAFTKLVEKSPKDAKARNNLAWLLLEAGDADAAFTHAERAYALDPENPHILDTLGQVLLEQKQNIERALLLLRKAASALPNDRAVQVNLARALVRTGQVDEAHDILSKVLADGAEFSSRSKAEALLQRLPLLRPVPG